jgi:hypothetical protein
MSRPLQLLSSGWHTIEVTALADTVVNAVSVVNGFGEDVFEFHLEPHSAASKSGTTSSLVIMRPDCIGGLEGGTLRCP